MKSSTFILSLIIAAIAGYFLTFYFHTGIERLPNDLVFKVSDKMTDYKLATADYFDAIRYPKLGGYS